MRYYRQPPTGFYQIVDQDPTTCYHIKDRSYPFTVIMSVEATSSSLVTVRGSGLFCQIMDHSCNPATLVAMKTDTDLNFGIGRCHPLCGAVVTCTTVRSSGELCVFQCQCHAYYCDEIAIIIHQVALNNTLVCEIENDHITKANFP